MNLDLLKLVRQNNKNTNNLWGFIKCLTPQMVCFY